MSDLKLGAVGNHVKALQTALKKENFYTGLIDGDFGPKTDLALKAFQTANKLLADGVAGPKTLAALKLTLPKEPRAVVAANYARGRAKAKTLGLCAKYVADALQYAGYKFLRQPSAYLYAAKGVMLSMGFTKMPEGTKYEPGDVIVIDNFEGNPHGHIQIFDGRNWISDFLQRTDSPYRNKYTRTLWRDLSGK